MTDEMPEVKRYKTAREILKDVVGLSWDNETATITMTPDSFVRCIDRASRPAPPADAMMREHRDAIAELIKIAARMATGEWLPSPFQKDHKRKVPRWILGVFDKLQRDACYNAQKIKRSVDVLRRALQPPALDKEE